MSLNKSRNMPVSHYDQDTMISHNVRDSNCHPSAASRNHPTTELQLGGGSRSTMATGKCEHGKEQSSLHPQSPAEGLSVENPSFPLKNSGSMGEAEERKPAASEGHFIPLDTSDGFPQSLGCWRGVSVSAQRAHTIAEHGRTDSHFNLKTEPLWSTALQGGTVKSGKSNKKRQDRTVCQAPLWSTSYPQSHCSLCFSC